MTVSQAAEYLNLSTRRIRQLLKAKAIKGTPVTKRFWLLDERSVKRYAKRPKPKIGRPKNIAC